MKFFLKIQSEWVRNLVEHGWGPPLILDFYRRSIGELKPKQDWNKTDDKRSELNVRALYNIFNGIYLDEFCSIVNYICAKEAWDILQVTHEGTSVV